jgi:hypothetical protein
VQANQDKTRDERRLLKGAKKARNIKQVTVELQAVVSPKLFEFIEQLCVRFLAVKSDATSREFVSRFALAFRAESFAQFGHESIECAALTKALEKTGNEWQPKEPRLDSLTWIAKYKNRSKRLSGEQESVCDEIRDVWEAFGKFLVIGNRSMEGGSPRGRASAPVDVIGEETWRHHRDVYTPWYAAASKHVVGHLSTGSAVSIAGVVVQVVIFDDYPEQLDYMLRLKRGTALAALKKGLDAYWKPSLLMEKPK